MTIKECIDIVDNAKPNQYGIKEKVMWLSFVDETIINDVLKTHEGYDGRYDDFTGYTEDKLSVPLIVPSPYDRLYPQYIKMMIDSENGETARYNNSSALYNTYLNEYKKYYNKTHMPLNATQKIPSPVSININSHLSDAQIEYIKRQLYYMLSEDFSEATSRDKLYDIVTNYVLNNLEMIRANDGKDGKDGKDGTLWIPFKFDVDIKKGEKKQAEFDFSRNIFRFGNNTYDDLDKNDFPNIYEWAVGDFLVSNNGNVLLITRFEWLNSEMLNFDAECILEAETIVVDESYNPTSSNPISGRAISEVFVAMDMYKANADLSNVDNDVFAAKAEEAGIGNAGLADEPPCKGTVDKYTDLPTEATEGDIYYVSNYYTDFDVNNLAFDSYVTGTQYTTGNNFTATFAREICELEGISAPTDISAICHTINIPYVVIVKANKYFTAQKYFAIEIYKLMAHTMDDGEGGTDSEYLAYFEDKCNAEYLREFQDGIFVNYQALSISSGNRYYYTIIPKSDIHEYPKGAYIYNGSEWVHM